MFHFSPKSSECYEIYGDLPGENRVLRNLEWDIKIRLHKNFIILQV